MFAPPRLLTRAQQAWKPGTSMIGICQGETEIPPKTLAPGIWIF